MKFMFKARDQGGHVKEGMIEALSDQSAIEILQKRGLVPVKVEKVKKYSSFLRELSRLWEGISQKELAVFFRQLATLIEAKVPIAQSLTAIEEQTENRYMRLVIRDISADIQEGMSFSEALEKHPLVFSNLTVNIIRAGEISGNLQQAVSFMALSIEKTNKLNSRIKSALYYPIFVMTVGAIVGFLVVTFILPKLTTIIKEMGIPVPWYTKAVIWLGDFMSQYWWAVLIVVLSIIFAFFYYIKTEAGKYEWDRIKIKIPIFGQLFKAIYINRFADNLSLMVKAGIPIVRSLVVASEVVDNSLYQAVILRAADEVKGGGQISTVLHNSPLFPPIVDQMTRIGEETGQLPETLKSVSRFYEEEVEKITRNMTTLIEPVLIIVLAVGVAIMVFAILLPIYNIAGNISG